MARYIQLCALILLGAVYCFLSLYMMGHAVPHLISQPDDTAMLFGGLLALLWLVGTMVIYGLLFVRIPPVKRRSQRTLA